jgi:hypothetical protein
MDNFKSKDLVRGFRGLRGVKAWVNKGIIREIRIIRVIRVPVDPGWVVTKEIRRVNE